MPTSRADCARSNIPNIPYSLPYWSGLFHSAPWGFVRVPNSIEEKAGVGGNANLLRRRGDGCVIPKGGRCPPPRQQADVNWAVDVNSLSEVQTTTRVNFD